MSGESSLEISRRDLGRLMAAGALGAGSSNGAGNEWTIGGEGCLQRLGLADGRYVCRSFRASGAGREWIHPSDPSDEFLVRFRDEQSREVTVTGTSGWRVAGVEQGKLERGWQQTAITLDATGHNLRVVRHYATRPGLPVVRQWTTVTNTGHGEIALTRVDTFRLRVSPVPAALELRWLNNFGRAMIPSPGNPIQSRTIEENTNQSILTGPYSPDCAWFSLGVPRSQETLLGGWEWSGPMAVNVAGGVDPCLISGGLDAEGLTQPLRPGASFDSPVGWYGLLTGDQDAAAALSHALVKDAMGPALPESAFPWAGYCTWATAIDEKRNPANEPGTHPWFPSEKNVLGQVEAAAGIGCELFLWDYGWFPRVGDWWFDKTRYPGGARRIRDAVRQRGMKLGLWFGFGNAVDESQVVREHPDWLAEYRGKPIPDDFFIRTGASTWKTRILCLAHRPARDWVKQQLARVIDEAELDWLKHDFDLITICQSRRHTHTPGDSRVAACEAFYEIMDFVRSRYPRMVCEHWMNDSATPDYGVLQRHHVQLIGDAYEAFRLRQMVYGHTQIFPLDRQHRYLRLEDSVGDLATVLQSSMIGGPWTLLSDPRLLSAGQRTALAGEIGLYKRFRGLAATGQVHRLIGRPHRRGWDAMQLWDPQAQKGALYVFRNEHPSPEYSVALRGLEPTAHYEAEFVRGRRTARGSGAQLMEQGLGVGLPAPGTCELVALRKLA